MSCFNQKKEFRQFHFILLDILNLLSTLNDLSIYGSLSLLAVRQTDLIQFPHLFCSVQTVKTCEGKGFLNNFTSCLRFLLALCYVILMLFSQLSLKTKYKKN